MSLKENAWTTEVTCIQEDNLICSYVTEKNVKKWTKIANGLFDTLGGERRSGKQCRERWHNHLDPEINKEVWTSEEKSKIFQFQEKFGNRWSKIANYMPGRTDNAIKNCFYSVIRKNIRKFNKSKPESQKLRGTIKTLLKNPATKEILFNLKHKGKRSHAQPTTVYAKPGEIVIPEVVNQSFNYFSMAATPSTCPSAVSPLFGQCFNFFDCGTGLSPLIFSPCFSENMEFFSTQPRSDNTQLSLTHPQEATYDYSKNIQ